MNKDGYSTTALNALSKGQYKSLRTNALASRKKQEARKKTPDIPKSYDLVQTDFGVLPVAKNPPKQQTTNKVPELKQNPMVVNQNAQTFTLEDLGAYSAAQKNQTKPATRYKNEGAKNYATAELPKFDTKYEKDFEDFFEWRYNKADTRDYDPVTDTETEHWRNVQKDIMKKYGWSEKEFNEKYSKYDNYRYAKMAQEELSGNLALAEKHPLLGTAASYLYNLEQIGEGIDTALHGLSVIGQEGNSNKKTSTLPSRLPQMAYEKKTGEKTLDENRQSRNLYDELRNSGVLGYDRSDVPKVATQSKEGMRQNAKESWAKGNKIDEIAYDMATGLGDMGINMALSGGNSAGMGVISGAQNAAQNEQHALERGIDPDKAAKFGLATGVVAGVMNTIGLDSVINTTGKSVISSMGKSALKEGAENVLEDIVDRWIDEVVNRENSEKNKTIQYYIQNGMTEEQAYQKSLADFLTQELASFGSGAAFGALVNAGHNLPRIAGGVEDMAVYGMGKRNKDIKDVANGMSADEVIQRLEGVKQAPVAEETAPIEINPEDVIYHSGILSRLNKADTAGKMEGSRDTGYYGTGHYFVDSAHKTDIDNGSNYGEKPYTSVDISKYNNLYRADTDAKADKLHNFSQKFMRYINGFNDKYYSYDGEIDPIELEQYKSDLYKEYVELFPENHMSYDDFDARLEQFRTDYDHDLYDRGDSTFTTFMKEHGYNGVDTRGTRSASTDRGVVIYDLDEDSVLQSNVTDAEAKAGLMNTRVRNENPIFDEDLDREIQKKIDGYEKKKKISQEYRNLYDASKIDELYKQEYETDKEIKNLEQNAIPYWQKILDDPEFLEKEAQDGIKYIGQFLPGYEGDIEAEKATLVRQANEGLADAESRLPELKASLAETQASLEKEKALSMQAYKQAEAKVNGISEEDLNNAVAAGVEEEMNPKVPVVNNQPAPETAPVPTVAADTGVEGNPTITEVPNVKRKSPEGKKTNGPDYADSAVVDNTAYNNKVISKHEYENDADIDAIRKYEVLHNEETLTKAIDNVKKHGEEILKMYEDGKEVASPQDVDESMLIMRSLSAQMRNTQDADFLADLTAKRNLMLSRLREAGTKKGQFIQAFAKWNNTPEGLEVNGTRIMNDRTNYYMSRHKDQAEQNLKTAQALSRIGNNGEKPVREKTPLTHEELKQRIIDKFNSDEFASIRERLNDNDIEYLTWLEESDLPTWQIADELEHKLTTGKWYTIDESTPIVAEKSNRLAKLLDQAVGGKQLAKEPKSPESFSKTMEKVRNTLNEDYVGFAKRATDKDVEFIATMFQEKVPSWQIEDELRHWMETGEWYTLDESIPVNVETSSKLTSILDSVVGGKQAQKATAKEPDTYLKKIEKIKNSLDNEDASISSQFNENDYDFINTMFEENIPRWQIEDEFRHKLETGEWYSLDESINNEKKPTNGKLKSALDMFRDEGLVPEKEPITRDELIEQVRNTLEQEMASWNNLEKTPNREEMHFDDEDIQYIASLIEHGATTKEIAEALNRKRATGKFAIERATMERVNELFKMADYYGQNSKKGVEATLEAYRLIANETVGKAGIFEKFEAWRYLAMLGNTKTVLRNQLGNKVFGAVTGFSNNLAAALEAGVDWTGKQIGKTEFGKKHNINGIERRKAILNPVKDKGLIKGAWTDGTLNRAREIMGTKYEKSMKDQIRASKSVFDSKLMQLYEKATDLGVSDELDVHMKYSTSLAGFMKANGLDESAFDAAARYEQLRKEAKKGTRLLTDAERAEMASLKKTAELMDKGRDYAVEQAEYATFHEDNVVAKLLTNGISAMRNSGHPPLSIIGAGVEGVVPFKKTPANILKSGIEYSPLGALKSLYKTKKLIEENTPKNRAEKGDVYKKKNKFTGQDYDVHRTLATDVIDSWSKSLTGTMLAALGYYLANKGILHVSDKDEKYQDELEGKQNYSMIINGKSYTVDWLAPGAMPLLLGAQAKKVYDAALAEPGQWYKDLNKGADALNIMLEPLIETSYMQGVNNVLESAARQTQYNEAPGGVPGAILSTALTGYLSQGIPTSSGQLARTIDPTRRSTDTYLEGWTGEFERTGRKMMNKIPLLSFFNEPYINARGETERNSPFEGNGPLPFLGNILYQTHSPAYYDKVEERPEDIAAREVYNGLDEEGKPIKNKNVFQSWDSTVKVNGEKLDPHQMRQYRETSGQANTQLRQALFNEPWFKSLDDSTKSEITSGMNTLARKIGRAQFDPSVKGDEFKLYTEAGGGEAGVRAVMDYLAAKYNPYGLDRDDYQKAVEEGEDLTKLEGFKEAIEETGLSNSKANQELYKQGGAQALTDVASLTEYFKDNFDLEKPGVAQTWQKVHQSFPTLTESQFDKQYREIAAFEGDALTISQKDIANYINKHPAEFGKKYDQKTGEYTWDMNKVMQLYNAYGSTSWKKVPYVMQKGDNAGNVGIK